MLNVQNSYEVLLDPIIATAHISLGIPSNCRLVRIFYKATRNSGTSPTLQASICFAEDDGDLAPLDFDAQLTASGAGLLEVNFPPSRSMFVLTIGGTTPSWTVSYYIEIASEY